MKSFLSYRIMYCTWVYPVTLYAPFFGYYFFNGLLLVLQCLHIFWAALIIRMALRFLTTNVRLSVVLWTKHFFLNRVTHCSIMSLFSLFHICL